MSKKTSRRPTARPKTARPKPKQASTKRRRKTAARPAPPDTHERPTPEEEAAFVETLIETGDAAVPDEHGKLPPGATHRIVTDKSGARVVVRRRFKMY